MRCYLYARVSSKEQESEGYSIPAQVALLTEYAQRHGLEVVGTYTEAETAKRAGRGEFTRLLKALKAKGAPAILLVEKTDRLYRNFKDYVALEALQAENSLEIHLVKEGEVLKANSTSHIKFIHGIKVLMAKNYIDNLSEEVQKGMAQKAMQGGWAHRAPIGYRMVKGELVVDEDHAQYVREAFRLYATGNHSMDEVRRTLHAQGHPLRQKGTLERMLKNRLYIAENLFRGEVIKGRWEPIIDRVTWQAAQRALGRGTLSPGAADQFFVYRGLLRCPACGGAFSGERKRGGRYVYYRCNSANRRECDNRKYASEAAIDEAVGVVLQSMGMPEEIRGKVLAGLKDLEAAKGRKEAEEAKHLAGQLTKARGAIRQAYQDRLSGLIDAETYGQVAKDYQGRIDRLEVTLAAMGRADVKYYDLACRLLELPKAASLVWSQGSESEKVDFLNLVCSNIFVSGGNPLIELKEPFVTLTKYSECHEWWAIGDTIRTVIDLFPDEVAAALRLAA